MWIALAFMSAVFAGITSILAKCGIRKTDSTVATAIRTPVVLLMALIMTIIVGSLPDLHHIEPRTWLFLVLSGISTGASWLCYFKALQTGDVNKVVPIDKSSTALTMALAFIFLHEKLTWIKGVCIVLIGAGTFLMTLKSGKKQVNGGAAVPADGEADISTDTDISIVCAGGGEISDDVTGRPEGSGGGKNAWRWLVYAVLSALFASLTAILGKLGIENVESNLGTAVRCVVVLLMAWAMVFITGKGGEIKHTPKKELLFICLSGLATGASWLCYFKALQNGPAAAVVPIDKLSILVTVLFSRIVFKEKLTAKSAAGLALIVAGTLGTLI